MLFRTPGRTSLVGLALAVLLALHLRPAFEADAAAFRAALSPPVPDTLKARTISPVASESADPFESLTPEPAYARLGAAVLSLVYRVEPDEEPLLPEAAPPGAVEEAAHRPGSRPHGADAEAALNNAAFTADAGS
ncbi:MAG TPA: hypothetical protein VIG90_14815 [Pedomonas sp.]|uniref:hypothetical protein n=1 Tax=Pedomonas sp. TaxID=2976421 RepID=UPI002F421EAC